MLSPPQYLSFKDTVIDTEPFYRLRLYLLRSLLSGSKWVSRERSLVEGNSDRKPQKGDEVVLEFEGYLYDKAAGEQAYYRGQR